MSWRALEKFRDPGVAKLDNLRRAARAGLAVPATRWVRARDVETVLDAPAPWPDRARIVRSAASDEDLPGASGAGRYESVEVPAGGDLGAAARRVARGLPDDAASAVFVQPLVEGRRAGVVFFDGFHWERTLAPAHNRDRTSGRARGSVRRGDTLETGTWVEWLSRVRHALRRGLAPGATLDLEFVEGGAGLVLLQARVVGIPVRRNPLLSLANHREILGDPPSPWIVSALERAGRSAMAFYSAADPGLEEWGPAYAVRAAERAWIDLSFFLRLMDRWGLPRRMVTDGIGGTTPASLAGGGLRPLRFLGAAPRLLRLQRRSFALARRRDEEVAAFARVVEDAEGLAGLFDATVHGLDMALRVNFAISGVLSGLARVRGWLGRAGTADVPTARMWRAYETLRELPAAERPAALDGWLADWGHRGPLESDPMRPRFRELRATLAADLARPVEGRPERTPEPHGTPRWLFAPDRWREEFRDRHVRVFGRLRERLLEEGARLVRAAALDAPEDVFFLGGEDLAAGTRGAEGLRSAVARRRTARDAASARPAPDLGRLDALERGLVPSRARGAGLAGVGLGGQARGFVRHAEDLTTLLAELDERPLLAGTVLVVPALEPAWGVVLGRVTAVVARLGGELSHAAILLREAGVPAVLDCPGALDLQDGAALEVDGRRGLVTLVASEGPDGRAGPAASEGAEGADHRG